MEYNFLGNVFENVETPKSQTTYNLPLMNDPLDISDWSTGISSNGTPIVKDNINKAQFIVNNNPEAPMPSQQQRNSSLQKTPSTQQGSYKKKITGDKQKSTTLTVMNGLISRGFQPHEAAGIVGNLMRESNLNTGAYNPNDVGLPGGGLAGWRGPEFSKLKAYASSQGKSWKDLDTQLDFLISSISPDVRDRLSRAQDPHSASEAWAYYEKYAGYDGTTKTARKAGWSQDRVNQEHKSRSDYAKEIYDLWNSQK